MSNHHFSSSHAEISFPHWSLLAAQPMSQLPPTRLLRWKNQPMGCWWMGFLSRGDLNFEKYYANWLRMQVSIGFLQEFSFQPIVAPLGSVVPTSSQARAEERQTLFGASSWGVPQKSCGNSLGGKSHGYLQASNSEGVALHVIRTSLW